VVIEVGSADAASFLAAKARTEPREPTFHKVGLSLVLAKLGVWLKLT
jgi:hypothetical protein